MTAIAFSLFGLGLLALAGWRMNLLSRAAERRELREEAALHRKDAETSSELLGRVEKVEGELARLTRSVEARLPSGSPRRA